MADGRLVTTGFRRIYRRHVAELLGPILASLGMLIAGLLIPLIVSFLGIVITNYTVSWLILFAGIYFGGVVSYFFLEWLLWYLDFWVLTDRRLIDVQLTALFRRRVAELPLIQVQDIAVDQSGFLQNVLGYGNVKVQTAAKEGFFIIRAVSRPQEVRSKILELAAQHQETSQKEEEGDIPTSLLQQREAVPEALTRIALSSVDMSLLPKFSPSQARNFRIIPLRCEEGKLIVASASEKSPDDLQKLALICGMPVEIIPVSKEELDQALDRYYPLT